MVHEHKLRSTLAAAGVGVLLLQVGCTGRDDTSAVDPSPATTSADTSGTVQPVTFDGDGTGGPAAQLTGLMFLDGNCLTVKDDYPVSDDGSHVWTPIWDDTLAVQVQGSDLIVEGKNLGSLAKPGLAVDLGGGGAKRAGENPGLSASRDLPCNQKQAFLVVEVSLVEKGTGLVEN